MISAQEQVRQIKHGVADLINEQDLVKKIEKSIKENKPLVVKLGLDPTAPDIHLGHTVPLRKLHPANRGLDTGFYDYEPDRVK